MAPGHVLSVITFEQVWKNYPDAHPCVDRDGNIPKGFDNQCAIRVGLALERSGVSFKTFGPGGRCPVGAPNSGMVASAQELANWLRRHPFPGLGRAIIIKPASDWEVRIKGKVGIVFFKDYWRRKGETKGVGSGDHIDLWNGSSLTSSFANFLRFSLGISSLPNLNPFTRAPDNQNYFSDLAQSSEIWFWEMK